MQPLLNSGRPSAPEAPQQGSNAEAVLSKQVSEALGDPQMLKSISQGIRQGMPPEKVIAEAVLKTVMSVAQAAKQAGVDLPMQALQKVVPRAIQAIIGALIADKTLQPQAAKPLYQATRKAGAEMFQEMQGETEGQGPGETPGEMEPQGEPA